MTSPQIIDVNGQQAVVLSMAEYQTLLERAAEGDDILAAQSVKARIAKGEETLPGSTLQRLVSGESPLLVLRTHRGLAQATLAKTVGLNAAAISKIENGGDMSSRTLLKLATALQVDAEILGGWRD